MNDRVRTLTAEENKRLVELANRQLHIGRRVNELKHLPLKATHEETGLPVIVILTMLAESAGYVNLEIEELLSYEDMPDR